MYFKKLKKLHFSFIRDYHTNVMGKTANSRMINFREYKVKAWCAVKPRSLCIYKTFYNNYCFFTKPIIPLRPSLHGIALHLWNKLILMLIVQIHVNAYHLNSYIKINLFCTQGIKYKKIINLGVKWQQYLFHYFK